MTLKIAPSILAADFSCLREHIEAVDKAGADWIHVDVMDGQYVPNLTFGTPVVTAVNKLTDLPLDVHLMVYEPDRLIPSFIEAGADNITVHIEAIKHINRTIQLIKQLGATAGISLNPGTPANTIENIIDEIDLILVMSVNPGFGGQSFIPSTIKKIRQIAGMIESTERDIHLEVDGGINNETASQVVKAGANVLVAGTAIFGSADMKRTIQEFRQIVK